MDVILIILVVLLLFGGGFGYRRYGPLFNYPARS